MTQDHTPYAAAPARYGPMPYRRTGRSGLLLPAISLGLWQNFGDANPIDVQRAILRRAFDSGVTHFDLANNYGPPYGSAERNFGRLFSEDLRPYRDELVISTKAGFDMWPGPYGDHGSRKYLLSSLDRSLQRTGLDHVDVFYHHRPDPETPLEETMGALATAVQSGRAVYAGISNYPADRTREARAILAGLGVPLLIHQPSYSMLNRWVEQDGLLDAAGELGVGVIAYSPLAQGLLTDRYLLGVPEGSRAARDADLSSAVTEETRSRLRALNGIAADRGQSLAQMALSWLLRDNRVTSALIGASSVRQLDDSLAAVRRLDFSEDELAAIDRHAPADSSGAPGADG